MNEYIFFRKGEKMPFESIIITGTSCSGKSTIAQKLCKEVDLRFKQVIAITTRNRRKDDLNYEYVSNEEFDQLLADQKLLVNSTYRGKKYGIKKEEYNNILRQHYPTSCNHSSFCCRTFNREPRKIHEHFS